MGDVGVAPAAEGGPQEETAGPSEEAPATGNGLAKFFRVVDHPHLGLSLKKDQVYSHEELVQKCRGNKAKLRLLEQTLTRTKVFQPVTEEEASKEQKESATDPAKQPEKKQPAKKAPRASAAKATPAPAPVEAEEPQFFKVVGHPNLGLKLKQGEVYSNQDLIERCGGNKGKLKNLEQKLKRPKVFQPVAGPEPAEPAEAAPAAPAAAPAAEATPEPKAKAKRKAKAKAAKAKAKAAEPEPAEPAEPAEASAEAAPEPKAKAKAKGKAKAKAAPEAKAKADAKASAKRKADAKGKAGPRKRQKVMPEVAEADDL